ncbi:carbonic anhydrase [Fodinicola feengrottensis]|uniref:carbonic anhydrase n=1 Tax=Fodinicola feengrottensis TaxID=435914 RepID=A0ABP4V9V6_9ACTN
MSKIDDLLVNAARYADTFDKGDLPRHPSLGVAVVTCMDARINLYSLLGLAEGEANAIRNGGGVVTDDVLRTLAISQRLLGTTEVMLIHHTGCGMLSITDDGFARSLEAATGRRPRWSANAFSDLDADVRESIARVMDDPFLPHKDAVRGFVYEVETGKLREVTR